MSQEKKLAVQEMVRGGGIVLIALIISYLFSFIYSILAARYLNVNDFGMLSLGISILGVGMTLAQLGITYAARRFVSFYVSKGDFGRIKGTLIISYVISISGGFLIGTLLFFASDQISAWFFHNEALSPILKIFAIIIPFSTFVLVSNEVFIAFKKPFYKAAVETLMDKVVRVLLLLLVIAFGGTVLHVSIAYLFGIFLAVIASSFFLYKVSQSSLKSKAVYNYGEIIAFSMPLFFASVFAELMRRFDKLLVGHFMTSSDVGIYSIAFTFAELMSIGLVALSLLYYPIIAGFLQKQKKKLIGQMFESITRLSFIITFPIFLLIILFAEETLNILYGPSYMPGRIALIILSFGTMISVFLGPTMYTLEVFKEPKKIFYVIVFTALLNLILDLILIPQYGIVGAAAAATISVIVQSIIFFHLTKKKIEIRFRLDYYLKYVASGFISIILIFVLKNIIRINNNIFILILFGVSFIASYGILLVLLKSFTEEDKMLLTAIEIKFGIKNSLVRRVIK
jgi:O-antigen/teichoic acid export membrane protein